MRPEPMTPVQPLMMERNGVAVHCRDLVKRYGDLVAVNGLDLEVRTGECFGLLGPNGAGKTTAIEILEGLNEPDSGVVEVLGQGWMRDAKALRERIGVQLQDTQLPQKLTVAEVVALFRSFYRNGPTPEEVLGFVQLQEKRDSWVNKLSGGQRQRLAVACALVGKPELLFLDEPTTGLDPQSRRSLWELIEAFRARGNTVLLTTHYMEEAAYLCDRVGIMDRGRIIAVGTPAELIASLNAEHVIEFGVTAGEVGGLQTDVEALGSVTSVRVADGNYSLRVSEVHRTLPELLALLQAKGLAMTVLRTHHATLEDVFVALTGRQLRDE
jgi:ABC-2 type transport system ATP-binding protein